MTPIIRGQSATLALAGNTGAIARVRGMGCCLCRNCTHPRPEQRQRLSA